MLRYGRPSWQGDTIAATSAWPKVHHWPMATGRFSTNTEGGRLAPVVVLGRVVKERFPGDTSPLGLQMLIGNTPFLVVGVTGRGRAALYGGGGAGRGLSHIRVMRRS